MPPKRKQTGGNAFFHFMQDFKNRQGRHLKSMQEVAEAAGPHWSKMSKEQRKPYEEMALMAKNNVRGGKFTSDGMDIEILEKLEKEEQKKVEDMKKEIRRIWDVAKSNGVLPLGYASEAITHSNQTHQIRPPMAGEGENNIKEVFEEMKYFLSNKLSGSRRTPILYSVEKRMKLVQSVLDTWFYDYEEDTPLGEVYSLEYMFLVLRNNVAKDPVWPNANFSINEIDKDAYYHATGICCEYHEVSDAQRFCSRSICVRQAYIICDNCCSDLRITLVPGLHLPDSAMTTVQRGSSRAGSSTPSISSQSSKYTNLLQSTRDDDSESVISFSSKSEWDNQSLISETSTSTTLDSDANFPCLGARKKVTSSPFTHFSANDWNGSQSNTSSVKSYACAMGTSGLSRRPMDTPSSFANKERSFASSRSSNDTSQGRGSRNFGDNSSEFPALGRGRGSGLRRNRRGNDNK